MAAHSTLRSDTRVLWRADDVVQLELGQRRIVISNVSSAVVSSLLGAAHGGPRATNQHAPGDRELEDRTDGELDELRATLGDLGFLAADSTTDPHWLPAQLGPDLAALAAGSETPAAVLQRRRTRSVAIHGTSRLAGALAATLAAAGIGAIQLVDAGQVRASDACPGGAAPQDEGKRFNAAAAAAIRRAAPDTRVSSLHPDQHADLSILTDPGPVDTVVRADLHLRSAAHLSASVDGRRAVIGPLVLPAATSCLRCADLHRTDRDPGWPLLAVQLTNRPRHRQASDVTLCVAVAGLAAAQALAFLDLDATASPAARAMLAIDATLEWDFPDWRLRSRCWPPHPDCDCGAAPGWA